MRFRGLLPAPARIPSRLDLAQIETAFVFPPQPCRASTALPGASLPRFHDSIRRRLHEGLARPGSDEPGQLNAALRLLARWRSELIRNELLRRHGRRVLSGPFAGLDFLPRSAEGCHVAKLLGCCELPLHPFVERAVEAPLRGRPQRRLRRGLLRRGDGAPNAGRSCPRIRPRPAGAEGVRRPRREDGGYRPRFRGRTVRAARLRGVRRPPGEGTDHIRAEIHCKGSAQAIGCFPSRPQGGGRPAAAGDRRDSVRNKDSFWPNSSAAWNMNAVRVPHLSDKMPDAAFHGQAVDRTAGRAAARPSSSWRPRRA